MEIDFNILRKKLIKDYNHVISSLDSAICEDIDMDRVIIPVNDLKINLERLRIDIIAIGAICDPNIKDCACVLDSDTEVKQFGSN
jgi:hypothetical protein